MYGSWSLVFIISASAVLGERQKRTIRVYLRGGPKAICTLRVTVAVPSISSDLLNKVFLFLSSTFARLWLRRTTRRPWTRSAAAVDFESGRKWSGLHEWRRSRGTGRTWILLCSLSLSSLVLWRLLKNSTRKGVRTKHITCFQPLFVMPLHQLNALQHNIAIPFHVTNESHPE